MTEKKKLTPRQKIFLQEYARSLNLTASIMIAYPRMAYATCRAYGSYLRKRHPLVSAEIKKIHQALYEAVDPAVMVLNLKAMYERNAWKTKTLKTTRGDGVVIKREVDCNPIAFRALSKLATVVLRSREWRY